MGVLDRPRLVAPRGGSVRMLAGVGTAFSVTRIGAEYVLITMDTSPGFSPVMLAYTASSPTGPFLEPRVLHCAPEASDRRIVHDATAHPQLSRPRTRGPTARGSWR
ncbi:hypothetical protein [Amycolatopsis regifaucium]|nr:hypothetical protein [Amycolatopsis regifaucium]